MDNEKDQLGEILKQGGNKNTFIIVDANGDRQDVINAIHKIDKDFPLGNVFTFPDNKGTGNLEKLLLSILTKPKFIDCFNSYKKCLKKNGFKPPKDDKHKIYGYDLAVGGEGRENERDYSDASKYDLEHEQLHPLKTFLTDNFVHLAT